MEKKLHWKIEVHIVSTYFATTDVGRAKSLLVANELRLNSVALYVSLYPPEESSWNSQHENVSSTIKYY